MIRSIDLPPPDSSDGKDLYVPDTGADWRKWLESHPDRTDGVWVAYLGGVDHDLTSFGHPASASPTTPRQWSSTRTCQSAFDAAPAAAEVWESTSPSQRKQDLWWVYSAQRPETQAGRIEKRIRRLTGMD